jgi:hypothetical protein
MHRDEGPRGPTARPADPRDVGPTVEPTGCAGRRSHGRGLRRGTLSTGAYADRRTRPFARRLARIARPARVRIRTRKPCVLWRFRLFGWKVRFTSMALREPHPMTAGGRYRPRRWRTSIRDGRGAKRAPRPLGQLGASPKPDARIRAASKGGPPPSQGSLAFPHLWTVVGDK